MAARRKDPDELRERGVRLVFESHTPDGSDDASLIRLASMIAIEANDEWLVGRAYMRGTPWTPSRLSATAVREPIHPTSKEVRELQAA